MLTYDHPLELADPSKPTPEELIAEIRELVDQIHDDDANTIAIPVASIRAMQYHQMQQERRREFKRAVLALGVVLALLGLAILLAGCCSGPIGFGDDSDGSVTGPLC